MNDGVILGSVLTCFGVTWGWLFKISYTIGKLEQKLKDLNNHIKYRGEVW